MAKITVTDATGSDSETSSTIDLGIGDLPDKLKNDIIEETGQFLVEQILTSLDGAKSPVQGESFPKLSKLYKQFKISQGGSGVPDLELYGDMKSSLTFKKTADGLKIGFFDDQAAKADGHNKLSGRENNTPQRRFLPDAGQAFKRDITQQVEELITTKIADGIAAQFDSTDFEGIESKGDLYDKLGEVLVDMSRSEIKTVVANSTDLMDMLIENDVLRFL